MRDVGKAPERVAFFRPVTQKQHPTSHMNTSQIVRFSGVLGCQNMSDNNQMKPHNISFPLQSSPIQQQKQSCDNHFSIAQNNGSSLNLKNFPEQNLGLSNKQSLFEKFQQNVCQLSVAQKMSLMYKCGRTNNPMKNAIFPLSDEPSHVKLVKVLPSNAEYQKLDTNIKQCDDRRRGISKYLNQCHRGWVKEMSDDEINILYEQIAKQLNFMFYNQLKHKQMEKQRRIQEIRRNEMFRLQQLQKQRIYNEFIEKAELKIKQNKLKIFNEDSSYEKSSQAIQNNSTMSEVIVIDSDTEEQIQNPKPCNSWIFQKKTTKEKKPARKVDLKTGKESLKHEAKMQSLIVSYHQHQEYQYVESGNRDALSKKQSAQKSREIQQTIDSYAVPAPAKKAHLDKNAPTNKKAGDSKNSQLMHCIQNMVVLIEKFDPNLRRK